MAKWHADIPLIVLTAANAQPDPAGPLAFLAPKWEANSPGASTRPGASLTPGKQIIATKSDHFIHRDEPELVVNAIREVLDATHQRKRNATNYD